MNNCGFQAIALEAGGFLKDVVVGNEEVSKKQDVVLKNNQSSTFMDKVFIQQVQEDSETTHDHKMIGLQGETRIFFFDCGKDGDIIDEDVEDRKEKCRNLLLKLYVAPTIRTMRICSTFFNICDNCTYACLFLMIVEPFIGLFEILTSHYTKMGSLLTAMMLVTDLLHNIIHSSTRLWNLGRVDLPLVLVMYAYYALIMVWEVMYYEAPTWVLAVLGFRLLMYYMSESCDYWMDVMVQNILKTLQTGKLFQWEQISWLGFPYSRLGNEDIEALEFYKGSFCTWNWNQSSLDFLVRHHNKDQKNPSKWSHILFYPGALAAIIVVFLLLCVVIILGIIPVLLWYCFSCVFSCCSTRRNRGILSDLLLF